MKEQIKKAIVDGDETSTTLLMRPLKNTVRVYANEMVSKVQSIEKVKPGDINAIRECVKGENYRLSFQVTGDTTSSVWSCGQSMGLIYDVPSCQELIQRIVSEAVMLIEGAPSKFVVPLSRL